MSSVRCQASGVGQNNLGVHAICRYLRLDEEPLLKTKLLSFITPSVEGVCKVSIAVPPAILGPTDPLLGNDLLCPSDAPVALAAGGPTLTSEIEDHAAAQLLRPLGWELLCRARRRRQHCVAEPTLFLASPFLRPDVEESLLFLPFPRLFPFPLYLSSLPPAWLYLELALLGSQE